MQSHVLGFPRIGPFRETKMAVEAYWAKKSTQEELLAKGKATRKEIWQTQLSAGLDFLTVGDFCYYDHILDASVMLGVIPSRFNYTPTKGEAVPLDVMFRMGRGRAPTGEDAPACEMTKWFDTNYHYLVPEFVASQQFSLSSKKLLDEVAEAKELCGEKAKVKAVLVGPVSYLFLGKEKESDFSRLSLLERILPVYVEIMQELASAGVEWIQIDEPVLCLDVAEEWRTAIASAYSYISSAGIDVKLLLTTYFEAIAEKNIDTVKQLPVAGVHLDLVRGAAQAEALLPRLVEEMPNLEVVSLGVVNGRNIWRNDLRASVLTVKKVEEAVGTKVALWVGSSCSLLHSPTDLTNEKKLDPEIKGWLAFARQKVEEVVAITRAAKDGLEVVAQQMAASDAAARSRQTSAKIHKAEVKARVARITAEMAERRSAYPARAEAQRRSLKLPLFPTTTIGSFPQTVEIRRQRRLMKSGKITQEEYKAAMEREIAHMVAEQEQLGLDVLVHGEPERNDMVEYFGELLQGFAFTENGWVQSYGSRGVKPPIIFGDVERPEAMTVGWTKYAQSLTRREMKGMLTGPVTILCWSFVRDDQPREVTANQIALALRDEVVDLEANGVKVIQIDEPAFREGLPLAEAKKQAYLDWAVKAFKLSAAGVRDETQIHTHMCYSEFNELIRPIAAMDADVITIETSRSDMKLLDAFEDYNYPNEIGPGVYDIHSPRIPSLEEMVDLLQKAAKKVDPTRLWVNPDCGLKTRGWPETTEALKLMVQAAKQLRAETKV